MQLELIEQRSSTYLYIPRQVHISVPDLGIGNVLNPYWAIDSSLEVIKSLRRPFHARLATWQQNSIPHDRPLTSILMPYLIFCLSSSSRHAVFSHRSAASPHGISRNNTA